MRLYQALPIAAVAFATPLALYNYSVTTTDSTAPTTNQSVAHIEHDQSWQVAEADEPPRSEWPWQIADADEPPRSEWPWQIADADEPPRSEWPWQVADEEDHHEFPWQIADAVEQKHEWPWQISIAV